MHPQSAVAQETSDQTRNRPGSSWVEPWPTEHKQLSAERPDGGRDEAGEHKKGEVED